MIKRAAFQFDVEKLKRALEQEPWEEEEDGVETRTIGLGSIMACTPSGKVYTPWAYGNLHVCPVCQGKGTLKPKNVKLFRKLTKKAKRLARVCKKRGWGKDTPARRAHHATVNRLYAMKTCVRCLGGGSAEVRDDEDWWDNARTALEKIDAFLGESEGDGSYLVVTQYREKEETEGDEEAANPMELGST